MKKKVLKFTALIGLIFFALNTDVLAENSDDSACPDDGGGPGITCGRYEGACWALDRISPYYLYSLLFFKMARRSLLSRLTE